MNKILKGAFAGALAIAPMTLTMSALHRLLPFHERTPLPPRKITEDLLAPLDLSEKSLLRWTLFLHTCVGALGGTLYPFIQRFRGVSVGSIVWILGYTILLPIIKYDVSAYHMKARRNILMIISHFVWGTSGAVVYKSRRQKELAGF